MRLVASSYFLDAADTSGVIVDGVLLAPPYDIIAIGDPHTITTAMGIPGGVLETLTGKGATGTVIQHDVVRVTALHDARHASVRSPGACGLIGRLNDAVASFDRSRSARAWRFP